MVLALDDARERDARVGDDVRGPLADRELLQQDGGRDERTHILDPEIVGTSNGHDRVDIISYESRPVALPIASFHRPTSLPWTATRAGGAGRNVTLTHGT